MKQRLIIETLFFNEVPGLFPRRQRKGQVLFFSVPHDHDRNGISTPPSHRMGEVARVVDGFIVDFDHDIPSAKARLFRAAAFFRRAHQYSVSILHSKELAELRRDVLDHQPATRRRGRHHHVNGRNIDIGNVDLGHVQVHVTRLRTHHGILFVLVSQLHLHGHGLALTAHSQAYQPARGRLVNHAPKLRPAFDRSAIHGQDNVVLFQASLPSGRVLIHHGDLYAFFFLQL